MTEEDALAAELRGLAEKYETLGEMRRSDARGEPHREDAFYRRLAARFPGALKELDRLPLDEIDRRAAELGEAARSGAVAPWMRAALAYHAALREMLAAKRRGERVEACEGTNGARCSMVAVAAARAAEAGGIDAADVRRLMALKDREGSRASRDKRG